MRAVIRGGIHGRESTPGWHASKQAAGRTGRNHVANYVFSSKHNGGLGIAAGRGAVGVGSATPELEAYFDQHWRRTGPALSRDFPTAVPTATIRPAASERASIQRPTGRRTTASTADESSNSWPDSNLARIDRRADRSSGSAAATESAGCRSAAERSTRYQPDSPFFGRGGHAGENRSSGYAAAS